MHAQGRMDAQRLGDECAVQDEAEPCVDLADGQAGLLRLRLALVVRRSVPADLGLELQGCGGALLGCADRRCLDRGGQFAGCALFLAGVGFGCSGGSII